MAYTVARVGFAALLPVLAAGCFNDPGNGNDSAGSGETGSASESSTSAGTGEAGSASASGTGTGSGSGSGGEASGSGEASSDESSTSASSTSASSTSSTSDDSSSGNPDDCGPTMRCLPPIPPDWSGPAYVRSSADGPPDCPPTLEETNRAGTMPTASDLSCECQCEPLGSCTGQLHEFPTNGCESGTDPVSSAIAPGACVDLQDGTVALTVAGMSDGNATCHGTGVAAETPPVLYEQYLVVCGSSQGGGSSCDDGGTCVPDVLIGDDRLCIHFDGLRPCPLQQWTEQQVAFADVQDRRGCGECSCSGPIDVDCAGAFKVSNDGDCTNPNDPSYAAGDCALLDQVGADDSPAVRYLPGNPGTCQPATASLPTGDVVPGSPVTLCCLP